MSIDGEKHEEFFDTYNAQLEAFGCGIRVAATATGTRDLMAIVDLDGKTVADLPTSIEPAALVAIMLLVEQSFEDGVRTGRMLEQAAS